MKILIDQNISYRLLARIESEFPNCFHVKDLDLMDAIDFQIFQYARQNDFDLIFTLDEDFNIIQLEHSIPPKIVWFRVGNCSTRILAQIVLDKAKIIRAFLIDSEAECLEIFG